MRKSLSQFSDREIALMLGAAMDDTGGTKNLLIAEAGYRLVRASGGRMTKRESDHLDQIMTNIHRSRELMRAMRRGKLSANRKQQPRNAEVIHA